MGGSWRRRGVNGALLAGGALAVAAGGTAAAAAGGGASLVLYQPNLSARTPALVANTAHIETLPFDGFTVNIPASWSVMEPGARLAYGEVFDHWLAPLQGRFRRVGRNFVLAVVRKAADPFDDDWSAVVANWRVLARAARAAGLAGILFDNEPYFERLWIWPRDTDRGYPLAAYQQRYRERGRELMAALRDVWPDIQLIVLHGPYLSEPRTPDDITLDQAAPDARDLSGHFFVGLLQGSGRGARVVDGGEVYQYRTAQDFARSYLWRKREMPRLRAGALIPPELRPLWAERVSVGFGLYDIAWRPGYPMAPPILGQALAHALARADDYVWLFTEGEGPRDYLVPGGVGEPWLRAIREARG
jgi:hypothetical protein